MEFQDFTPEQKEAMINAVETVRDAWVELMHEMERIAKIIHDAFVKWLQSLREKTPFIRLIYYSKLIRWNIPNKIAFWLAWHIPKRILLFLM